MKYRMRKLTEIEAWTTLEIIKAAEGDWKSLPDIIRKEYEAGNITFRTNMIKVKNESFGEIGCPISMMIVHDQEYGLLPVNTKEFLEFYEPVDFPMKIETGEDK